MTNKIWTPGSHLFITGFVFLLLFTACSKDSQDNDNYLKVKIDGTLVECTSGISANKPEKLADGTKDPTLRIKGVWDFGTLELFILTERPSLSPGEYVFTLDKRRYAKLNMNAISYYAGPSAWFSPPQLHGTGKIILSKISNDHVKGSFEFTTDSVGGITRTIIAGEFNIKRN